MGKYNEGRAVKKQERARPRLQEVIATLRAHVPELRERYGVRTLGVFGGADLDEILHLEP